MKLSTKLLLGAGALILSANVIAAKECPTTATIQANTKFTIAQTCSDGDKDYWCMVTSNFNVQGSDWNVAMIAAIDAKDSNNAVSVGQDYFQTKVVLGEPERYGDDEQMVCLYAMQDYQHAVAAFSPPISLPGASAKFKMFK